MKTEFRMPQVGDKIFTRFGDEGTVVRIAVWDSALHGWGIKDRSIEGDSPKPWLFNRVFVKGPYIVQLKLSNEYHGYSYDEIRLA